MQCRPEQNLRGLPQSGSQDHIACLEPKLFRKAKLVVPPATNFPSSARQLFHPINLSLGEDVSSVLFRVGQVIHVKSILIAKVASRNAIAANDAVFLVHAVGIFPVEVELTAIFKPKAWLGICCARRSRAFTFNSSLAHGCGLDASTFVAIS